MGIFDRNRDEKWRDGVFLCTVQNSFEADIIESKLKSENIPCVRNYRGASNAMELYLGSNVIQDIEIYVPEETLDTARELIKPVPIEDDYEEG